MNALQKLAVRDLVQDQRRLYPWEITFLEKLVASDDDKPLPPRENDILNRIERSFVKRT